MMVGKKSRPWNTLWNHILGDCLNKGLYEINKYTNSIVIILLLYLIQNIKTFLIVHYNLYFNANIFLFEI